MTESGVWAALKEVYPTSRQQRCWQHKKMNVLNCLPKLSQSYEVPIGYYPQEIDFADLRTATAVIDVAGPEPPSASCAANIRTPAKPDVYFSCL